ncbi:hypothetical protein M3G00_13655 [Brevibacterium casei]|uniref:UDP-N-acetylmuramyl pentapeptide phosphotransferase/UDP-N-acetylglucosamine-1-phosphate transferase n=1 Tax=Brevibacterium casei TaxID=33889 RepID=A0AB34XRI8_9MICO|nr:hypothetical protein [Brevibacterium casei]KZE17224.1 hypothetical protein AVW13_14155 [Brevibacterium casei]MCT2183978.1 hypothetical protein [Brevibacterium casei]
MSILAPVVFIVAAVMTALSALLVLPVLRQAGVVDVPTLRSSHSIVTVRGGGIAIGSGITVAVSVAIVWHLAELGAYGIGAVLMSVGFLVLTWCYSVIGLSDDLDSLQPVGRLVGQVVLAAMFSICIVVVSSHGLSLILVFTLIGVVIVNAVNFVDGLNGYVSGWAIVAGCWYAFVGYWVGQEDVMLLSLALAGGATGFLPFNAGRAKAFLGDTGSYGIGAAVFAIVVLLFVSGVPIVVIVAPLVFIFADVGLTLVLRLFRGENILMPHRAHIYQRIQQAGWSHGAVALFHAAMTVLACLLAVPTLFAGNTVATYPAHVFWVGLLAMYALLPLWLRNRAAQTVVVA